MGDGANDALRGYIKSGMRGNGPTQPTETCPECGKRLRTVTGNWTVCNDGERHSKTRRINKAEAT
jgi:hypothetical protein